MKIQTHNLLSIAAVGISTGGTFSDIHEALTHILGWDVFTHELADKAIWDRAATLVRKAHPAIVPFADRIRDATGDADAVARITRATVMALGLSLDMPKGSDDRTEHPLESLQRIAPDKPVIVVGTNA